MLMSGTPSYEQSACKARNLLFASFEAHSAGLRMAALNCYHFSLKKARRSETVESENAIRKDSERHFIESS